MASSKSIAIIIASSRTPRLGPKVVDFIKQTIEDKGNLDSVSLSLVDVADFNLPVFNEPVVPAAVLRPEDHVDKCGRQWALEIARYDGYVLVSPEYNYGMPGSVKNAVDFLYHEWRGKPVAIITYGIQGGIWASAQLGNSLRNVGLKVGATRPLLYFHGGGQHADTASAITKGKLGVETLHDWQKDKTQHILQAFNELRESLIPLSETE